MVVYTQEEQMLHRVTVIAGNFADIHLIQRYRNRAHTILRQHLPEQSDKLLRLHGLIAQQFHKLIQNSAEDLPQLGSLFRFLQTACLYLRIHLDLQSILQRDLLHEAVQSLDFIPGSFAAL